MKLKNYIKFIVSVAAFLTPRTTAEHLPAKPVEYLNTHLQPQLSFHKLFQNKSATHIGVPMFVFLFAL